MQWSFHLVLLPTIFFFFSFWGVDRVRKVKTKDRKINTLRENSSTCICSSVVPKKWEVFLLSSLRLTRLPITRGHINIWHVGAVSMAVLFTNTILGFQRLLCNSWESPGLVCLWMEESHSLIHSPGGSPCLAVTGLWTKDQGVSSGFTHPVSSFSTKASKAVP